MAKAVRALRFAGTIAKNFCLHFERKSKTLRKMAEQDSSDLRSAEQVLALYPGFDGAKLETLGGGLINRSFAVHAASGEYVLQRVHPVFSPQIHGNIHMVTEALVAAGFGTPRLVRSKNQHFFVEDNSHARWRLLTRVPGVSVDRLTSLAQARAVGAFVARFHSALINLPRPLAPLGFRLHDPAHHLVRLRHALQAHSTHRLFVKVCSLAEKIFAASKEWEDFSELPKRIAHGDLKINNFVFAADSPAGHEHVVALVDLDTLSAMPLYFELGDAWRSWCNPQGEDTLATQFDLAIFEASTKGYLENLYFKLLPVERRSLAHGVECISLELATRFAIDALQENYFGWDATRFPAAGEHNLLRAMGQWNLYEQARSCRAERLQILLAENQ